MSYRIRPASFVRYSDDLGEDTQDHAGLTVWDDDDSYKTGVLDKDGRDIWFVPERGTLGFCR